ncbi:mannose-1-phosphate guanylyltransferase/mannose-6-phosphate isomerase [Pseudoalteromonas sp. T1lg75]|uniref:mannose-1-phosphate guanylyltransferase/mannose-6-phosphate isomerase n=1 Tax=Pseudoalteromonas sp. T1lg75 TaxID=2077102 RepID=UPI001319F627|nr:mannose-1-phosphate guanylyltransferase/mannose-6-phosphate isomerase [Pseudoalteromonas sp. T1lg75]
MILPVLLAGGGGTRLWPLSRQDRPKQFLRLNGEHSLLQQTALRFRGAGCLAPLVICSAEHRFMVAQQLLEIDMCASAIILEPEGKNTAPAAALAALWAQQHQPDASLFFAPADHAIANFELLSDKLGELDAIAQQHLVLFGITPSEAQTGFGYIRKGKRFASSADCTEGLTEGLYRVAGFTEKPDRVTAEYYLQQGHYYWNSGMLLAGCAVLIEQFQEHRPQLLAKVRSAATFSSDLDFTRVDEHAWQLLEGDSLDYALLERSEQLLLCPLPLQWFDLGSFAQLYQYHSRDQDDNVVLGSAVCVDSRGNLIAAEEQHLVATLGIEDTVIVHSGDTILVAAKAHLDEMPKLVAKVAAEHPQQRRYHRQTFRPWGHYEVLNEGEQYKVKRIELQAQARLSLQAHQHRSEHWVVVSGDVLVQVEQQEHRLSGGQSIYIQAQQRHRLTNVGTEAAIIIEVQSGDYLGEDDIIRFDDDYGR